MLAFSLSNDFEIELLEAGYIITVDLNKGVINIGDEKIAESTAAAKPRIMSVLRHLYKKIATLNESVKSFVEVFGIGST
jgi:hypothetical protein